MLILTLNKVVIRSDNDRLSNGLISKIHLYFQKVRDQKWQANNH